MQSVIRELEATYDYVLIDAPPLLPVTDATVLSRIAVARSSSWVQARFGVSSCACARDAGRVDAPVHGLILNFLPTKGPDAYTYYAYGYDGNKQKDVDDRATGCPTSTPRARPP